MHADRLTLLADVLERDAALPISDENPLFDLGDWAYQKLEREGNLPTQLTCATTACAIGRAMLMPEFRALGLGTFLSDEDDNNDRDTPRVIIPQFNGSQGWYAVSKFFDIHGDMAEQLFSGNYYDSEESTGPEGMLAVAARIRRVVAGKHPLYD